MSGRSERSRSGSSPSSESGEHGDHPPPRKRQRVRLSCLECRRRKLSCDREFPCSRCFQSGTPERCEYETRPGLAPPNKLGLAQGTLAGLDVRLSLPSTGGESAFFRKDVGVREPDRIRRLELEVAQLKGLLAKQVSLDGSTVNDHSPPVHRPDREEEVEVEGTPPPYFQSQDQYADKEELRFFRGKEFKTRYFGPRSAFMAFSELGGLCPFMKETSEEWLRPLHIQHDNKDRQKRAEDREKRFREPDLSLEALLPSREETDNLVHIYLDQFEQIHRIIHLPSFRREYAKFWDPNEARNATFTCLLLAMIAITSCLDESPLPRKFEKLVSSCHTKAVRMIEAAEQFMARQSEKHRRLIHYQIACLLYLAKRINTVKKKRFWKSAGAMTQDAISVGLHREPSRIGQSGHITPFNQEMRRRIWATITSYDVQASFDQGLPTILSSLQQDTEPPSNIDDDEFDEDTTALPPSKPSTEYTFSSFQSLSRQSLALRLELNRVLAGPPEELDYEQVIRYTNEINQEIDSLPSWDVVPGDRVRQGVLKTPLLAYTLLHIQLRQYIIPLHQPYLKLRKTNSKYQYSEIIYYNAARDMTLLNDKLAEQSIRTLNFLREDALTLAINLCSVTMQQPVGSTNMIMINSQHTLQLLEKCLAMKEDRILRCGNNEPWGYSIMCAAVGLLEAHLNVKTSEAAKAASAERFINLHYKLLAGQDPPLSSQQSVAGGGIPAGSAGVPGRSATPFSALPPPLEAFVRSKSVTPFATAASVASSTVQNQNQNPTVVGAGAIEVPGTPWWLPSSDPSNLPQVSVESGVQAHQVDHG
ncbi:fungal-specific transcription factor domain-containing protein [Immersiella caudata]|uniref:Fungal-specific transcription factor domain-containing protein n=1 Tax=Immersiella caudata TaxID=314043 RepID=A0AA40C6J6_9PEZI|nr:fungal-specific transcription factor domain-containing protein [Immersiella caudata]